MMYIAEIDLKKKKRQLIPLTRICLFGNVDGKRKNLEKIVPLRVEVTKRV